MATVTLTFTDLEDGNVEVKGSGIPSMTSNKEPAVKAVLAAFRGLTLDYIPIESEESEHKFRDVLTPI